MRLNGKPLEVVNCLKYLWSQVATVVGCERDMLHGINFAYKARREPENLLRNTGLGINL